MQTSKRHLLLAVSALGLGFTGLARAHGNEDHPKKTGPVRKEQKDWGVAGDAKAVRRTIEFRMGDNMRFTPERIDVRQGETLRFRVQNTGKVMHEFVIGTKADGTWDSISVRLTRQSGWIDWRVEDWGPAIMVGN